MLKSIMGVALLALAFGWQATADARPSAAAVRPPDVLIIVADDLGYSDIGAFGGEISTPNLDALARRGAKLTGFYTAPACSPTRAMLMTGRDNHEVGLGTMAEALDHNQRGKPGYEGALNFRTTTLAERLTVAGYRTMMTGKWHLGLRPNQSPTARGFQRSFALLDGAHNHYGTDQDQTGGTAPASSYSENGKAARFPVGRYSSDYFADRMIEFLQETPAEQPVFAYLAFTDLHWPLQAPAQEIAKYRGRYDAGPDALRTARLERMKALGLAPKDRSWRTPFM